MAQLDHRARLDEVLERCAAGALSPNLAVMQLLIAARSPAEAQDAIAAAVTARDCEALRDVRRLFDTHGGAWKLVREMLASVDHTAAGRSTRDIGRAFDRAAALSPAASVALYSLGSEALLADATSEIIAWLQAMKLIAAGRRVLDLGCGIGRLEPGLAPQVSHVLGIEVSPRMAALARMRCAALRNVAFILTSGRDLAPIADASMDLIVAVDSFPYVVQSGAGLAQRHIEEAARILEPGGDLVMFNFSYRGDPERDRRDVAALARAAGLAVERNGTAALTTWDALIFHLRKRG
jgi:SAM-dependent methyltransferase